MALPRNKNWTVSDDDHSPGEWVDVVANHGQAEIRAVIIANNAVVPVQVELRLSVGTTQLKKSSILPAKEIPAYHSCSLDIGVLYLGDDDRLQARIASYGLDITASGKTYV